MSNTIPNNIPIIMEMAPAIEAFHQTAKYYPPIQERMQMILAKTSKNRSRLANSAAVAGGPIS
jgi:hypothetical protein